MLTDYTAWALARAVKRFAAIFIIGPVLALFAPFAAIGEVLARWFNRLYNAR